MGALALSWLAALWLGVLTSISPCPLATNIAAIAYVGKRVGRPGKVLATGLLYAAGRTATYVGLAVVVVASVLSIPRLSQILQAHMNQLLGPILIVVGMFLLELIELPGRGRGVSQQTQRRAETWGVWGGALLGVLFALSFCPVSAALFFGSLIPLAVKHESSVALPALYGVGTALPVIVFAFLIAFSATRLGKAYDRLAAIEWWARRITGAVFILVGVYYALMYIFVVL